MADQSPSEIEVIVTLHESHLPRLHEIAEQLISNGLKDVRMLESIGIITGKGSPDSLIRLSGIAGVSAIEPSGSVQIAPPGADIQ